MAEEGAALVGEKLQGLRDKTKVTIVSMSKAVWPQIVACIIALLLITYVPWISLALRDLVYAK